MVDDNSKKFRDKLVSAFFGVMGISIEDKYFLQNFVGLNKKGLWGFDGADHNTLYGLPVVTKPKNPNNLDTSLVMKVFFCNFIQRFLDAFE